MTSFLICLHCVVNESATSVESNSQWECRTRSEGKKRPNSSSGHFESRSLCSDEKTFEIWWHVAATDWLCVFSGCCYTFCVCHRSCCTGVMINRLPLWVKCFQSCDSVVRRRPDWQLKLQQNLLLRCGFTAKMSRLVATTGQFGLINWSFGTAAHKRLLLPESELFLWYLERVSVVALANSLSLVLAACLWTYRSYVRTVDVWCDCVAFYSQAAELFLDRLKGKRNEIITAHILSFQALYCILCGDCGWIKMVGMCFTVNMVGWLVPLLLTWMLNMCPTKREADPGHTGHHNMFKTQTTSAYPQRLCVSSCMWREWRQRWAAAAPPPPRPLWPKRCSCVSEENLQAEDVSCSFITCSIHPQTVKIHHEMSYRFKTECSFWSKFECWFEFKFVSYLTFVVILFRLADAENSTLWKCWTLECLLLEAVWKGSLTHCLLKLTKAVVQGNPGEKGPTQRK